MPLDVAAESYLTEKCHKQGHPTIQVSVFSEDDIIFIIDSAQMLYRYDELWKFIKSAQGKPRGPKFCLFTTYGNPYRMKGDDCTPDSLREVKQVSILCSHNEESPAISLFLNDNEFGDALARFCLHPTTKLPLERAAREYLRKITSGHPGALIAMLSYVRQVFISRSFLISERKANGL